jgi:hypothetical protein
VCSSDLDKNMVKMKWKILEIHEFYDKGPTCENT